MGKIPFVVFAEKKTAEEDRGTPHKSIYDNEQGQATQYKQMRRAQQEEGGRGRGGRGVDGGDAHQRLEQRDWSEIDRMQQQKQAP